MQRSRTGLAVAVAAVMVGGAAHAAPVDRPWIVHVGAGRLSTEGGARVRVMGQAIPGAAIRMDPRTTAVIEIGRFVTPALSVNVSAGIPVAQSIEGRGSIRPYGAIGRGTYGPAAATIAWHMLRTAAVRPYVGAGLAYLHVFDADDGAVRDLRIDDGVGPVIQGGVDVPIGSGWGLFVDVKKAFVRTDAHGTLGGAPLRARLRLDPLVLHTGVALRF